MNGAPNENHWVPHYTTKGALNLGVVAIEKGAFGSLTSIFTLLYFTRYEMTHQRAEFPLKRQFKMISKPLFRKDYRILIQIYSLLPLYREFSGLKNVTQCGQGPHEIILQLSSGLEIVLFL